MQKQQPAFKIGDKVLWHDLVCEISSIGTDDVFGVELGLDVNGRTYYDYACNVEKLDT